MTYILRIPGKRVEYTLTEKLHVSFYRRQRATGRTIGGLFREVEDAGIDKDYLQIVPAHEQENKTTSSRGRSPRSFWHVVRRRLDALHAEVREMRPDDVARIQAIDNEIGELRLKINSLQSKRHQVAQQAWRNGDHASLGDLTEQAEELLAENERKRAEVTS